MPGMAMTCDKCDVPGGVKTFTNQVCMPLNGKVQAIDHCIHQIVAALNAGGVGTVASCCGHGTMPGNIVLDDGRVIAIFASMKDARMCDKRENRSSSRSPEDRSAWLPPRLDGT